MRDTKPKEVKIWNGRGWPQMGGKPAVKHVYVAAFSRADAVRLINQAAGWRACSDSEIKVYFSACWGNTMDGITRERGVWVTRTEMGKPERLI